MHNQAALLLRCFYRADENEGNKTGILNRETEAYFAWLLRITSPRSAYNSLYHYKPYSITVCRFIYNTRHISKDSRDIFCPLNVVSGITEVKNNQHWEGRSTPFLSKYGCCTRFPNLVWQESQQNNMWSFNVHLVTWFLALTLFFLPAFFLSGYLAYDGSSNKAKLETPWISVSAGNSVPLCLTFNYSMRSSNASFNVSCKTRFTNEENLIFKLIGYHGKTWFKGQVLWKAEGTSRVIFFFLFLITVFFLSFFSLKLQPVTKKLESLQLIYAKMVFLEQDSYPSSLNDGDKEKSLALVSILTPSGAGSWEIDSQPFRNWL